MSSTTIIANAVEGMQKTPVIPTLVRTRPNEWIIRDDISRRPLLFSPNCDWRHFDHIVGEWLLLPHHMAFLGERIHASKTDLHTVLRDRYYQQVRERLSPGVHTLESYKEGCAFWLTDDPRAVEAVRARIGELDRFENRRRDFLWKFGAKPYMKDEAVDGSRRMKGSVFGDVSRLPGRWQIFAECDSGEVGAWAEDDEARAVLDALDPPGPARIPGLDVKSTGFPHKGQAFVHTHIGLLDDRRAVALTDDYELNGTGAPARSPWHRVSRDFGLDVLRDLCAHRM